MLTRAASVVVAALCISGAAAAAPTGPTPAEKRAMQVASVRAIGADRTGTTVTVTFRGDVEKALGHGNLENAVVAVLLRPEKASAGVRGIATTGPGAFGRTLTRGAAGGSVVRKARRLFFIFPGKGASSVGKVDVKVFLTDPAKHKRTTQRVGQISPDVWSAIINRQADVEKKLELRDASLSKYASCEDLMQRLSDLRLERGVTRGEANRLDELEAAIDKAIDKVQANLSEGKTFALAQLHGLLAPIGIIYTWAVGETPHQTYTGWKDALRSLKLDKLLAKELQARNKKIRESLDALEAKLEALIKDRCKEPSTAPPPKPPELFIRAKFNQDEFATHYTVVVTSGSLGTNPDYLWTLIPPEADKTCDNRGVTTSKKNEFVWYHGDDVCNHKLEGAFGHRGQVNVEVVGGGWICKTLILGTSTHDGEPGVADCKVD